MSRRAWYLTAALVLGVIVVTSPTGPREARSAPGSLAGQYSIYFVGQPVATQQPESGVGVASLDDLGTLTGFEIFNNGTQVCEVGLTGRYTVNANGMGRMTLSAVSPIETCAFTAELAFVVIYDGKILKMIGTEPGFVVINEEWHRRG